MHRPLVPEKPLIAEILTAPAERAMRIPPDIHPFPVVPIPQLGPIITMLQPRITIL